MSNDFLTTMASRRSVSSVTDEAPSDQQLHDILAAVVPVADHKALRPWRLVIHRGDDRRRLGDALARAEAGSVEPDAQRLVHFRSKAERAPLVIAIIAERRSRKIPKWEQEAVASGAGHLLELALFASGWGAMWRSGAATNSKQVRRLYGLQKRDRHLGWLYVGGIPARFSTDAKIKNRPDPARFISTLDPDNHTSYDGAPVGEQRTDRTAPPKE